MSPEQQVVAAAVRDGRPIPCPLDGRSDVYSLGVLLYESLVGELPDADEAVSRKRLALLNPDASRGLTDIVHKCLAREARDRYSDAERLAVDLRRHLADLPLRGVPNRSVVRCSGKWRRRQPHTFLVLASCAVATVAARDRRHVGLSRSSATCASVAGGCPPRSCRSRLCHGQRGARGGTTGVGLDTGRTRFETGVDLGAGACTPRSAVQRARLPGQTAALRRHFRDAARRQFAATRDGVRADLGRATKTTSTRNRDLATGRRAGTVRRISSISPRCGPN